MNKTMKWVQGTVMKQHKQLIHFAWPEHSGKKRFKAPTASDWGQCPSWVETNCLGEKVSNTGTPHRGRCKVGCCSSSFNQRK